MDVLLSNNNDHLTTILIGDIMLSNDNIT